MLDDSWRMDYRSLDSDGKEGVSVQFHEDQKIPEKYGNILFYQKMKEAKRRDEVGPQGAHTPSARAHLTPRLGQVWPTCPASDSALHIYLPYGTLILGERPQIDFRRL